MVHLCRQDITGEETDKMKKMISLVLIASILLISMGSVFAATVPGMVYTDHTAQEMDAILRNAGVKDVKPMDWYAQGTASLLEAGLIAPDSNGNINPLSTATAGDAVSLITKALGIANKTDTPSIVLQKAKDAGLIEAGVATSTEMKRIDAAKLLAKAFNMSYISVYNKRLFPFEDFYAFTPDERGMVRALNERGLFLGYAIGGGKYEFRPNNIITKGELYTLIARLIAFSLTA